MKRLTAKELKSITGGLDFNYSIINSFSRIIDTILEVGRSFGTSIRRIIKSNICDIE